MNMSSANETNNILITRTTRINLFVKYVRTCYCTSDRGKTVCTHFVFKVHKLRTLHFYLCTRYLTNGLTLTVFSKIKF